MCIRHYFQNQSKWMLPGYDRMNLSPANSRKKHTCPFCSKGFANSSNMKRHMVSHTGEQKYKCSICDKKFQTHDNFTGHMNSHAGAKPFQCKKCLKCFSRKNILSSHNKRCAGWSQNVYS